MSARIVVSVLVLGALAACGEKPQANGGARNDQPAFQGTGKSYAAPGWKQGEKAAWEQQLRARAQNGQNDYTRVP